MKKPILFNEFIKDIVNDSEVPGATSSFAPPKYLVQPAEGDTGFALVKAEFDKSKPFKFFPRIKF